MIFDETFEIGKVVTLQPHNSIARQMMLIQQKGLPALPKSTLPAGANRRHRIKVENRRIVRRNAREYFLQELVCFLLLDIDLQLAARATERPLETGHRALVDDGAHTHDNDALACD